MQRNDYFPSIVVLQAAFFGQLAHGLPEANISLMMPALDIPALSWTAGSVNTLRVPGGRLAHGGARGHGIAG